MNHSTEEASRTKTTATVSFRALWTRGRSEIAAGRSEIAAPLFVVLGIFAALSAGDSALFIAIFWFFGVPLVYLMVRYLWLRLCRDPFLSPR
jgi:heme/copper-type cytochrome/quinol oxidase subunit 1